MIPMYPVGFMGATATPSTLLNGLVAFWDMEENGAVNRVDASGNGNDLTVHGAPAGIAGKVGNCAQLNNASDGTYLDTGAVSFINTDFTVAFWYRGQNFAPNVITGRYSGGGNGWFIHIAGGLNYIYFFAQGSTENAGNGITGSIQAQSYTGQWLFILVQFRASDFMERLVIKDGFGAGLCDVTGNAANFISVEAFNFEVCGYVNGNNLPIADYDAYGVWNRLLINPEITELYNGGAGLQYPF